MTAENLPYFKFISEIIDSGLWARMSPAARALYPALLRFSDRNFKPVFPGTRLLLKLTGFKQKASLRRARQELETLGLISMTSGSGRTNTCYHFRFDALQGDSHMSPGESSPAPLGARKRPLRGDATAAGGAVPDDPGYNQIHININNNVPTPTGPSAAAGRSESDRQRMGVLERRFGREMVDLAISECELAGIPASPEQLEDILFQDRPKARITWADAERALQDKISPGSLEIIRRAFLAERDGLLIFADHVPGHLRMLLERVCGDVFFEPEAAGAGSSTRREFWQAAAGKEVYE